MRFPWRRDGLACREAIDLINDYLDDALPDRQRVQLETHLAACPHCTEYLAQLRATVTLAERTAPPAVDGETERALAELYRNWREK
jgi:anti-sigma factor RsiW